MLGPCVEMTSPQFGEYFGIAQILVGLTCQELYP